MKKLTIALMLLALTGCATYENTRKSENLTKLHVNADYQTSYRIIVEGMRDHCHMIESSIIGSLYPDNKTAKVSSSSNNIYLFSIDLRAAEDGGTDLDFYSYYKKNIFTELIPQWVDEGKSGCDLKKHTTAFTSPSRSANS